MKKTILFICTVLLSAGFSNAQTGDYNLLYDIAPQHIKNKMDQYEFKQFSYMMMKNNSFDTPLMIQEFDVDIFNNETLSKVYEFTYTPAGVLKTRIRKDAALNNEQKITYNFGIDGQLTSIIYEQWGGANWLFDFRQIIEYTPTGLLSYMTNEIYNNPFWEYDGSDKIEYTGGEATPSMVKISSSDDNINWQDILKIEYSYNGVTPSEMELIYWDPNYLNWVPTEKWEITNWGPKPFKADFLFNPSPDEYMVTDNVIYKINGYDIYPADFTFYGMFNTATWSYDDRVLIASNYNMNNERTELFVSDYNGATYDSSGYIAFSYDVCYGYNGYVSQDYVSPNTWTITSGEYFQGYTTPHSGSCYVYAYNFFSNFSDAEPNGNRTRMWNVVQSADVGIEEESEIEPAVYPNPVSEKLTIDYPGEINGVEILTTSGMIVRSADDFISGGTIDLSNMIDGMYFVRISTGNEIITKLIVKE